MQIFFSISMQMKKAFTLLELVVAMAIIATLLGLSLFGIQAVQRSQRDTERRASLKTINIELANYYAEYRAYPTSLTVTKTSINFGTKSVPLSGVAKACTSGEAGADRKSNGICTVYCYLGTSTTYRLGVNLESNGWGTTASTSQQLGPNGVCWDAQAVFAAN